MINIHICVISSHVDNFCPQKRWMWLSNAMHLIWSKIVFFSLQHHFDVESQQWRVPFNSMFIFTKGIELMGGKISSFVSFQNLNLWFSGKFYKIFEDFELGERFTLMIHKVNPKFSCEIMSEIDKISWAF